MDGVLIFNLINENVRFVKCVMRIFLFISSIEIVFFLRRRWGVFEFVLFLRYIYYGLMYCRWMCLFFIYKVFRNFFKFGNIFYFN